MSSTADESGFQRSLIEPQIHEAKGNLIYTENGLAPYRALHETTAGLEDREPITETFTRDGERWTARLEPKSSHLEPRDDPGFDFERVREFKLKVKPQGDRTAPPSASFTIAPRWPDMESLGDSPTPRGPSILGVNVEFSGSYLSLEDYPKLLKRGMGAFGIDSEHFTTPHEYSNIVNGEVHVRGRSEALKPLVVSGGTLDLLAKHVGTGDGVNRDDRGVKGRHVTTRIDTEGASKLIDGHALGKEIKHYYAKYEHSDEADPLAHPKLCVTFSKCRTDGNAAEWVKGGGSVA